MEDLLDFFQRWSQAETGISRASQETFCWSGFTTCRPWTGKEIHQQYTEYGQKMSKYVCDTSAIIFNSVQQRKNILF